MPELLPTKIDPRYWRQASLDIIQRTMRWITCWLHDVENNRDATRLFMASTTLVQLQNELIIEIYSESLKPKGDMRAAVKATFQ